MPSSRAALPCSARCQRNTSSICWPTRMTGLSEVIGSWKIIAMSLPRFASHLLRVECQQVHAVQQDRGRCRHESDAAAVP